VITSAPEPHDSASGEITLVASEDIKGVISAPCLRSSLESLTDSTAAMPPVTARSMRRPRRERLAIVTPVSLLTYCGVPSDS
jgi:hypothetical protein